MMMATSSRYNQPLVFFNNPACVVWETQQYFQKLQYPDSQRSVASVGTNCNISQYYEKLTIISNYNISSKFTWNHLVNCHLVHNKVYSGIHMCVWDEDRVNIWHVRKHSWYKCKFKIQQGWWPVKDRLRKYLNKDLLSFFI